MDEAAWQAVISAFPARTAFTKPGMEVFEALGELLELLLHSTTSSSTSTLIKQQVEQLLKGFCLSRTLPPSAALSLLREDTSQPQLDRLEQCFALLYAQSDSRDMLQIAGELQDACRKPASSASSSRQVNVEAACLHALAGIARSRGKALAGHLADTLLIADSSLSAAGSTGTGAVGSGAASSSSSSSSSSAYASIFGSSSSRSPTPQQQGDASSSSSSASTERWIVGAIRAVQHGLVGAGEAAGNHKTNWPTALRFLAKAVSFKRFGEVRLAAAHALSSIAQALSGTALQDKCCQLLLRQFIQESSSGVRMASAVAGALIPSSTAERRWSAPPSPSAAATPPKIKLEALDSRASLQDVCEAVVFAFNHHQDSTSSSRLALVRLFVQLVQQLPTAVQPEEIAAQAQWALQFAAAAAGDVSLAALALREAIGSQHGERLQLALARTLVDLSSSSSASVKQACGIELCHLIATLGEAAGSLAEPIINSATDCDASVLRQLCISVPQLIPRCSDRWSDELVNGLGSAPQAQRACRMLSAIVFAAASANRTGAVPATTQLFGLCKALASRTLEEDAAMDNFAVPGWHLLCALLSLGPAHSAPHLVQFLMLWAESFDCQRISDRALTGSITALVFLLRNAEDEHVSLLKRSISAMLLPHKDKFALSARSLACQTAFFRLYSELAGGGSTSSSTQWTDSTMLAHMPLAMFHLLTANNNTNNNGGPQTSLLHRGGVLDGADDVLSSAHDDGDFSGKSTTNGDNDDDEEAAYVEHLVSCGLHAVVGRRARMRKPLAQRVKLAMQGGAYAEPQLSSCDARTVPSTSSSSAALADSAVCVVASTFATGSSKLRQQILASLQAKLSASPPSLAKDYNLSALLLVTVRMAAEAQPPTDNEASSSWQQPFFTLCWPFLRHRETRIRRSAAEALAIFTQQLCTSEYAIQVKHTIEAALVNVSNNDQQDLVPGALLCAVKLGGARDELGAAIAVCCGRTASNRAWALHCWIAYMTNAATGDAAMRHLPYTLQLLNGDLFASAADASPPVLLLARMLVCMANALNAEMMEPGRQRVVGTLVSVWMWLKDQPAAKEQCLLFLDRLYYFHSPSVRQPRPMFALNLFDTLQRHPLLVFNTALPCFLRMCEDEVASGAGEQQTAIGHVPLIFDALERFGRSFPRPGASAVLHHALGPMPLRQCWQELEMTGACSSNRSMMQQQQRSAAKYLYPPDLEEDACKTLSEIIRISEKTALVGLSAYLQTVLGNRETRWQTKLVAVEALNQLIRRTTTTTATSAAAGGLDALVASVCQTSALTVGDFSVVALQTRALACLYSVCAAYAPCEDAEEPGVPVLRQYEAQLNATLRPALQNRTQADLSEETGQLVALLLVRSISTSAKRLVSQLDDADQDEEDSDDDDDDEQKKKKATSVLTDDVTAVGFRLGRCCAFARLAIASFTGCDDDGSAAAVELRPDALERLKSALPPALLSKLCLYWLRIMRDYWVLASSTSTTTGMPPRRHPDATYQGGRTREDVEQLLPLYAQAWPVCALAAAYCLNTPYWPLPSTEEEEAPSFDSSLLLLACTRALSTTVADEEPFKQLRTLEVLRPKLADSVTTTATTWWGVYAALLAKAKRASSHRKLALRDACLRCLQVFLSLHAGAMTEREWASLFSQLCQCLPDDGNKMRLLSRFHLDRLMPSSLTQVFMASAAYQASMSSSSAPDEAHQLADCIKVFVTLNNKEDELAAQIALHFAWEAADKDAVRYFGFWAGVGAPRLSEARHGELVDGLLVGMASTSQVKTLLQGLVSLLKRRPASDANAAYLQDVGVYYASRLWERGVWAHSATWLADVDSFALVCALHVLLPASSPNALLDAFFRDESKHTNDKQRRVWSQFLTQLVQCNKSAFQAYLAPLPQDQKLLLREFMMT